MKSNLRNLLFSLSSCLVINLCLFTNANADTQYLVQPSYNDASLTSDNNWHFSVAPYFWASSINADNNIQGISNTISVPFSQLTQSLDFGGEINVEANNGPWTIMFDPTYVKLSDDNTSGITTVDTTSKNWIVDGGVFFNMFSNPISADQLLSLELLAGGRYLSLENSLGITTPNNHISVESNDEYLVPIVGARLSYDVSQTSHFWLRGDVGGFGIDNVTNTWQGILGYAYSLSDSTDIGVAYRVLKIDINKTNANTNTYLYGPEVGIAFKF